MSKEVLGSLYYKQVGDFQRGLYPIARTVKAEQHDLAVVEMEIKEEKLGNIYGLAAGIMPGTSVMRTAYVLR